ncbi:hypothetical protein ACQBAU_09685 [Propionibacteriaceae bacterium Y2011]
MSNPYQGNPGQSGGQSPYGQQPQGGQGGWQPQAPQGGQQQGGYGQSAGSQPSAPQYGQGQQPSFGQSAGSQPSAPQYGQGQQPSSGQSAGSQPSAPQYGGSQPPPAPGAGQGQWGAAPTQVMHNQPGAGGQQGGYDNGGQWGAGNPPQQPPKKKSPVGKIVLFAGIGVLVIALVVGGVLFYNEQQRIKAEEAAAEAARIENERQITTAGETVTGFLESLKAGDLNAALAFAAEKPEGPLLTEEVFAAAAKAAPVGDITAEPAQVTQDPNGAYTTATVKASYTVDGKTVEKDWELTKSGEDWKLATITAPVTFGSTNLKVLVNGTEITTDKAEALPGKYTVTTDSEYMAFKSGSFTVVEPGAAVSWLADAAPTEKATTEGVAAVKESLNNCLKQKSLAPANCPFKFNTADGVNVDANSIKYTLEGDPFANAKLSVAGTVGTLPLTIRVGVTATGTRGSSKVTLKADPRDRNVIALVSLDGTKKVLWRAA